MTCLQRPLRVTETFVLFLKVDSTIHSSSLTQERCLSQDEMLQIIKKDPGNKDKNDSFWFEISKSNINLKSGDVTGNQPLTFH
jgi:hypothetical protein